MSIAGMEDEIKGFGAMVDVVAHGIKEIFENWNETLIWSCLQGIMGEIHMSRTEDAAMAILGDFIFYAGTPSEEFVRMKPESCKQDFVIMVPQNEEWGKLIEMCYGDRAKN